MVRRIGSIPITESPGKRKPRKSVSVIGASSTTLTTPTTAAGATSLNSDPFTSVNTLGSSHAPPRSPRRASTTNTTTTASKTTVGTLSPNFTQSSLSTWESSSPASTGKLERRSTISPSLSPSPSSVGSTRSKVQISSWKDTELNLASTAPTVLSPSYSKASFLPSKLPLMTTSTNAPCASNKEFKSASSIPKITPVPSAKPSDIRAATKARRAIAKAEQERQEMLLKNQQEAQLKMNKIRAEIDAIKAKEAEEVAALQTTSTTTTKQDKEGPRSETSSSRTRLRTTPSFSLVPEMRRRASHRDLVFDEDRVVKIQHADELRRMSTHSPVTGREISQRNTSATATMTAVGHSSLRNVNVSSSVQIMSAAVSSPTWQSNGERILDASQESTTDKQDVDRSTVMSLSSAKSHQPTTVAQQQHSPATLVRCSITTTPQTPTRDPKQIAKLEEEKARRDAQRKKLDEAKEYFQAGHDLCWKYQDSGSALGEYRKALFIRESLLGKYHDETGRSYYWIGRSLVKLQEYDEALVAFSRAQRIFERVLSPTHKYRKWTDEAILSVFRQVDYGQGQDEPLDHATYKLRVDESIAHERAGDKYRKRGMSEEAIAEYREAIVNVEEYHPDSADIYCKIAILLRQQGDFDRALEEQKSALEIYELSLGAEHPQAVKALSQTLEKKKLTQKQLALMEKLDVRITS